MSVGPQKMMYDSRDLYKFVKEQNSPPASVYIEIILMLKNLSKNVIKDWNIEITLDFSFNGKNQVNQLKCSIIFKYTSNQF